jgi:hypothetical protein
MKKEVKEKLDFGSLRKGLFDKIIVVLIILVVGGLIYLAGFYTEKCEGFECFKETMEKCAPVYYVNEETEASWGYEIKGLSGSLCEVEVKLLLAKQGELGIDSLVGEKMSCFYPKGLGVYPEEDLSVCHGRLKEDLQQIIINKLHAYIIENLGKIDKEINAI